MVEQPAGVPTRNQTERQGTARKARAIASGLAVLLTLYMAGKYVNGDLKDAEVWYEAGRRVLTGKDLAWLPHYRYPPTFAVLISPLCAFGSGAFYFLWYAINLALFGLLLRLSRAVCFPHDQSPPSRYCWLPALLVAAFAVDNLILGQTNILITALIYWALLEDSRGRQWRSGLALGAGIAIKAFPAPLAAYLVCRGRLSAAGCGVLSCLFLLLVLPAPARGFGRNLREVEQWGRRVVMPYLSRGEAGDWGQHAIDFRNQSLAGVARRYLTRTDAQVAATGGDPIFVNLVELSPAQANAVIVGVFALLGIGFVGACGWQRPQDRAQRAAEYALVTALLLLVSALAWTYFFVMLLLPVTVCLRFLDRREELRPRTARMLRAALWAVGGAAVLLVSDYARALGSLCWATAIVALAIGVACRDVRRSAGLRA